MTKRKRKKKEKREKKKLRNFKNPMSEFSKCSECSICYDKYTENDIIYNMTECVHYFHYSCLNEWVSKNGKSTCPLCREHIPIVLCRHNSLNILKEPFIDKDLFDTSFKNSVLSTKHDFTDVGLIKELINGWLPILHNQIQIERALSLLITVPKYYKNDTILIMKVLYEVFFLRYKTSFITDFWEKHYEKDDDVEVVITDNIEIFKTFENRKKCFCIGFTLDTPEQIRLLSSQYQLTDESDEP